MAIKLTFKCYVDMGYINLERCFENPPDIICRTDSMLVLNQWNTLLQSNAVSHWLGANLASVLPNQCCSHLCIRKGVGSNLTHYKLHCCEEIISQSLRCYVRIQGISSHSTNPATLEYSSPSTRRVNSFPPSATYMHRWTGSTLVQVMAWRRTGDEPLPEPMLIYC